MERTGCVKDNTFSISNRHKGYIITLEKLLTRWCHMSMGGGAFILVRQLGGAVGPGSGSRNCSDIRRP